MKNLKTTQILTSNYPYYKFSLDYALNSLEFIGAALIEFYACYPHFHIDDMEHQDVKRLKKKLTDRQLYVDCFTPEQCLYPVNIAAIEPNARKRSMDVFKKSIRFASELGAEKVVVLAGFGMLDEEEADIWKRSVESLGILCDEAEVWGIELVLETSPREYTSTHNAKDIVRMIQQVKSHALKGMIDTATLGYSGETMESAITDLGEYLSHVHVADGVPNGHLILGEGTLKLCEMVQQLDRIAYTKSLSLEILNDRYMRNPHEAMETSFKILKQYILEN